MAETVSVAEIAIWIDGSRHSGGYDLNLHFLDQVYPISPDFNAGDRLHLKFSFDPIPVSDFQVAVQNAYVCSDYTEADTWRCTQVSIYGRTSTFRCFRWTVPTSTEDRNSHRPGNDDNPLTFRDFDFNWGDAAFWMQNNRDQIGKRTLRKLCMPGAHDAGMCTITGGTAGGAECNTITQTHTIAEMLQMGVRFFDIRPVISGGEFYCGHYNNTHKAVIGWQGANGDSIANIISYLNEFTSLSNELVVLYLSHDLNTDVGHSNYRPFTQDEYNQLIGQLAKVNYLYNNPGANDLTEQTLDSFISDGAAGIVFVVDTADPSVTIPDQNMKNGFYYPNPYFNIYNEYAKTNKVQTMIDDQLGKMKANQGSYFLLSWTMTQSDAEAGGCAFVPGYASILQLAKEANERLDSTLRQTCTPTDFPNIIYTDRIEDTVPATLAMWLNTDVIQP